MLKASVADALPVIGSRFLAIGLRMLAALETVDPSAAHVGTDHVWVAAECAGRVCDSAGWDSRPAWADLANGARPPPPPADEVSIGEWQHGWQYHASNALERAENGEIFRAVVGPHSRRNARSWHKARLHSCGGRYASEWLTAMPTTFALRMTDAQMRCATRQCLGLPVLFDGEDAHGHYRLSVVSGGRTHARHTALIAAWRQVLVEAGASIPDRNNERMLSNTHVPVPPGDTRRMDNYHRSWTKRFPRLAFIL